MGIGTKRQERFKESTGFKQENNPFPVTSCGRRRPFMHEKKSPMTCWKTHKRKPGTKEFSKGSCIPK